TRADRSSPSRRAMLVPRPVAMRSRTRTVGALAPRSTADSMLRLTPERRARAARDSPRSARWRRIRSPRCLTLSPLVASGARARTWLVLPDRGHYVLYGVHRQPGHTGGHAGHPAEWLSTRLANWRFT